MKQLQYFDQIEDVMVRSGQLVMQYFLQDIYIDDKTDGSLVTNVDIENEAFLRHELLRIMPDAGILAEESGSENEDRDFIWVIDPLDGTRNFIKGIPHFCICVALTFRQEPIVAAVYNPVSRELYYAEKGYGVWLNRTRNIVVRDQFFEKTGVIVVLDEPELQYIQQEHVHKNIRISDRYFGCAGLDTVYVAMGYIDFVVFKNISWWDVAAGMLLIQEAGCLVDWHVTSFDTMIKGRFVAGHPSIFKQFLMIIDSKICN